MPSYHESRLDLFREEISAQNMAPLWDVLSTLVTPTPRSAVVAHCWRYDVIRTHLMRAGDLITAEEAERRVLVLENPGLRGESRITTSLYAGVQLVLPGEVAPCHRHSQSALRFVLEGDGGYTAVDGERIPMSQFDLVITPNDHWHDHANLSDHPMIWLDGLDLPAVAVFDASFGEKFALTSYPEDTRGGESVRREAPRLSSFSAVSEPSLSKRNGVFHYPYCEWRTSLDRMMISDDPDPHLGYALKFINPRNGEALMNIISAHVRLIPKGFETKNRCATDGSIFTVVGGHGTAFVDDVELELNERDIFVVPSWKTLVLRADEDLILFGYSDRSAQEKLGLYREQLN